MDRFDAVVTRNRVTIETLTSPVTLAFAYAAIGVPNYSDVPAHGEWCDTEAEAEEYGALIVGVGNWRSFRVEKRYFGVPAEAL